MRTIFKVTILFLLIPMFAIANNPTAKHTKTKTIKKEFNVSANALVDLDNKYGSIDIKTWDQNKFTIEIIITTDSGNESNAQKRLDAITIEFSNTNSHVSVKTKFRKSNNSWNLFGNNNSSMDIKYIVRMPVSNSLNIDMDYGDVMLDKLEGKADFNCDYGKLIVGELLNDSNTINLDYCNGSSIDFLKNGNINIDYTTLDVEKGGNIDLNSDYCTMHFGDINNLKYNTDYGSIGVESANSIIGNSDYANLKFGTITNTLKIEADYGSLKVDQMGSNFKLVDIDTEYIGIKIGVNRNSSFRLTAVSQYGNIKVPDGFNFTKQVQKNSHNEIEGTYNGSNGGVIRVRTQYGSIKISEN